MRFFASEVIQTSNMDCGPACLKGLFEGFGVSVNYNRLREACQTDVDGTSIDSLEEVAVKMGLDAEQVMLPADFLLLSESSSFPAIVVTCLPNGLTHFIVVWKINAGFIQIMDPSIGRRWVSRRQFMDSLYIHRHAVPAAGWREWAGLELFADCTLAALRKLGIQREKGLSLIDKANNDSGWRTLAALDAGCRMAAALVSSGAIAKGNEAFACINGLISGTGEDGAPNHAAIPERFWSVRPLEPSADRGEPAEDSAGAEPEMLALKGAVLLSANRGLRAAPVQDGEPAPEISPALQEILTVAPSRPWHTILSTILEDGSLLLLALLSAVALASVGFTAMGLGLAVIMKLWNNWLSLENPVLLIECFLYFLLFMFMIELPVGVFIAGMGRRFESRLRVRFLSKLPKLGDRYFHSRLVSDMVQRAHELRQLRALPAMLVSFFRTSIELLLTASALVIVFPAYTWHFTAFALAAFCLSYLPYPLMREQDMRVRTLESTLARYYLDALQGLIPLRAHSAEDSLQREHEGTLVDWNRSMLSFYRTSLIGSSLGMLATLSAVIWLTWTFIAAGGDQSLVLLFLYWLMRLPQLSAEMATEIGQYPGIRNLVLRFNEIIEAPEEWPESSGMAAKPPGFGQHGVSVSMSGVSVTLGAQQILKNINLQIKPGEHIAVVGPSGAGKSTLAGILMGWQSHYEGELLVNNGRLDGASLDWLRHHTAWVDPSVQIWNSPVSENILYGSGRKGVKPNIIRDAELQNIISSLPDDGNCPLGEGGGLVSGGEGQRVRLARALQRDNVRLAMLDEPFRGLDRETRHRLLLRCRQQWADATLFFISHDLFESLAFDRVLVVENGEIVENDNPRALMHDGASRYRALLEAEEELKDSFISRIPWRFLRMHKGRLHESESRGTP